MGRGKPRPAQISSREPKTSLRVLSDVGILEGTNARSSRNVSVVVQVGLFLTLLVGSSWGIQGRGLGEGTELRVLTRATSGLATGPEALDAWGGLPLEGPLPSAFIALALRASGHGLGLGAARIASFFFAALGVAATYATVRSLVDVRAARASALVLATLPLFAVHAGTLLPDTITFASGAVVFGAVAVAVHGHVSRASGIVCLLTAALFLLLGVATRGVLVGACVPLAPIVAMALGGPAKNQPESAVSRARGLGSRFVRVGLVIAFVVALGLGLREVGPLHESAITFDVPLATAMHELFPWSCALPVAWSCLVRSGRANHGTRGLASSILVGLGLVYAVQLLAARAGAKVPFVAPYLVAMAIGVAVRDFDRIDDDGSGERLPTHVNAHRPSSAAVLASLVFAFLLARDAWLFPETALVPVSFAKLPAAVLPRLAVLVPLVAATFVVGLAWLSSPRAAQRRLVSLVPPGTWFLAWGTIGALLFLLFHHRVVEAATSPLGALDAYHARRSSTTRLGLFGVSARITKLAGETSTVSLSNADDAVLWLGDDPSHFVAAASDQRAELSSRYRARFGRNVPEIEVRGASSTLLLTGQLLAGETSQNPLDAFVLDRVPEGYFPAKATFDIPVSSEGVRVEDSRGRVVRSVSPGFEGVVKVLYRATGLVPSGFCSFVHVDARPTRAATEDREMATYPTRLWRAGDFVVVSHPIKIPHGAATGPAEVGFGLGVLPCTDDRRAAVTSGRHVGNRIYGGTLDVR